MTKIPPIIQRILFILLSSTVMVFFSEKAFWYIQGYAIFELVLFYALPVAACVWVIELFKVQRLSGVVLVGSLFGFLVEGVLTPVVYEAGLLDPIMPAYFVGWHGMLSLVLGWYFIRKCLVEGRWKHLLLASSLFGLFWGFWSLTYRLPESIQEFQILVEAGESFIPGAWSIQNFALYTLVFSFMLAAAHWLLGKGFWQNRFPLRNWEIILLVMILVLLYLAQVMPVVPFGILKLAGLILLVVIPLKMAQISPSEPSMLSRLDGSFQAAHLVALLFMPVVATLVYALAEFFLPPEDWLRGLYISIYSLQTLAGGGFFVWAWVDSVKVYKALKFED